MPYPIFDDLIASSDYYPDRVKEQLALRTGDPVRDLAWHPTAREQLARELVTRAREQECFERARRLRRKRARHAWYVRWQPIIWSLVVLALLWLGLGGVQWLVGI